MLPLNYCGMGWGVLRSKASGRWLQAHFSEQYARGTPATKPRHRHLSQAVELPEHHASCTCKCKDLYKQHSPPKKSHKTDPLLRATAERERDSERETLQVVRERGVRPFGRVRPPAPWRGDKSRLGLKGSNSASLSPRRNGTTMEHDIPQKRTVLCPHVLSFFFAFCSLSCFRCGIAGGSVSVRRCEFDAAASA